jgi:hypothetical protein
VVLPGRAVNWARRALAAAGLSLLMGIGAILVRDARDEPPVPPTRPERQGTLTRAGITVRYTRTWRVSLLRDSHVTNPVLRFELSKGLASIRVRERLPPLITPDALERWPQRPRRFRLGRFRALSGEGDPGRGLSFQDGGRALEVAVVVGSDRRTRAEVEQILASLRVVRRKLQSTRRVRSRAVGEPWHGRLVAGVQLPASGSTFFTWDPVLKRSPNRGWRRWGAHRTVRTLLAVLAEFHAAHSEAPRIGVGDLSRPRGGDFGPRYGLPGHASHENGLDADVYYPRLDRRERPPRTPAQIDRALAQELVDRFVHAGAVKAFVGPNTGLHGDPGIVQALGNHDAHLHVRLP